MTAALGGSEWSAARPGRTLPLRKTRYPLYRRLGGPQGRSERAENLVPPGFDPGPSSPYLSRYTDWATGPTIVKGTIYNVWCILIVLVLLKVGLRMAYEGTQTCNHTGVLMVVYVVLFWRNKSFDFIWSPLGFYVRRHLTARVLSAPVENEVTLHERVFDACQALRHPPPTRYVWKGATLRDQTWSEVSMRSLNHVEDIWSVCCESWWDKQ